MKLKIGYYYKTKSNEIVYISEKESKKVDYPFVGYFKFSEDNDVNYPFTWRTDGKFNKGQLPHPKGEACNSTEGKRIYKYSPLLGVGYNRLVDFRVRTHSP